MKKIIAHLSLMPMLSVAMNSSNTEKQYYYKMMKQLRALDNRLEVMETRQIRIVKNYSLLVKWLQRLQEGHNALEDQVEVITYGTVYDFIINACQTMIDQDVVIKDLRFDIDLLRAELEGRKLSPRRYRIRRRRSRSAQT